MSIAIVTGSAGLIGSEAARYFAEKGMEVVGVDNDMRRRFFGDEASTRWNRDRLQEDLGSRYEHASLDIRDDDAIEALFARYGNAIELVIHTAAQPSHDWAAREPKTDFSVNANGTLNLLEAVRAHSPEATFIFTSTNKVYGDAPNRLPLIEQATRWEIDPSHQYADGIGEDFSIDQSMHSLFGASKVAADMLVQEYGRYFGMKTVCFRGGCLTGPQHAGAQLHGFLAYLMKCTVSGDPYTIFGYKGKQVRDNIHATDVVSAFAEFHNSPKVGAVYNLGGGRQSNVSMLEAIAKCEEISGRELSYTLSDEPRIGDHQWYISDFSDFGRDYPAFELTFGIDEVLRDIYEKNAEDWTAARR